MGDSTERDRYDIEKEIYETQWANIRHHWIQTFAGTTLLSTLIALAIVPVQLIRSDTLGTGSGSVDTYVKAFVAVVILALGVVTFLNQRNHHMRSLEARKVVVAIEREWGLYDDDGRFIFQEAGSNYAYAKFAGGEKRLTYSLVQSAYIVVITAAGLLFVVFA